MKLTELRPSFIVTYVGLADEGHGRTLPDGTMQWGGFEVDYIRYTDNLAEAQGLWFDCPKCYEAWLKGPREMIGPYKDIRSGVHGVMVWFGGRDVPERMTPKPRWQLVAGTGYSDLVIAPSILMIGGCAWHGFVGQVAPGEVSTC